MYAHRPLRDEDLQAICSFPQTPEELFYMSPRSEFPLTPDQILSLLENRFDPTVIVEESTGQVVAYANFMKMRMDRCGLAMSLLHRRTVDSVQRRSCCVP